MFFWVFVVSHLMKYTLEAYYCGCLSCRADRFVLYFYVNLKIAKKNFIFHGNPRYPFLGLFQRWVFFFFFVWKDVIHLKSYRNDRFYGTSCFKGFFFSLMYKGAY